MMEAFWLSLILIFLAELGDKTQLVSLTLATRFNATTVLAGIFTATLLVHVFSAALGELVGGLLPTNWIHFFAGLAFVGFGLWTLRGDNLDEEEDNRYSKLSPFWLVTITFFLAEFGDKTMLGTVTLATTHPFLPVWIGSTLGMVLSDGLAIWVGQALGRRLPERVIKVGTACIFFIFGVLGMIEGGMALGPVAWVLGILIIGLLTFFFFYILPRMEKRF
ncbi:TMEM165/GDT1 family protein [Desulfofundulus sp.]|uniref:TMEM165/GDT1 family protein n=1 Tax=Desulfofundulus sp. TaxID=2282750 RepID=UPI003C758B70